MEVLILDTGMVRTVPVVEAGKEQGAEISGCLEAVCYYRFPSNHKAFCTKLLA